jgi:hypothetical protein
VLGLAQVQAVHVPTGARSVAVRHAHRVRGCCQLRQEAIQPVTTGSWNATTQRGASIQSDLGCVSTPNIADHTLQCTGWRPKQKQRCQTWHTMRGCCQLQQEAIPRELGCMDTRTGDTTNSIQCPGRKPESKWRVLVPPQPGDCSRVAVCQGPCKQHTRRDSICCSCHA